MKIFSIIFILLLSLQSLIKADDIRDFEIEGISIGDSALEFFNKNEIKVKQYPKSNKFSRATILIDSESYDYIQFHFKTKDISVLKKMIFVLAFHNPKLLFARLNFS